MPSSRCTSRKPRDDRERILGARCRTELHADGVRDPAHEVDMRAVERSRAFAHPYHVRGKVVGRAPHLVPSRQRALEVEQQRFVACVELDASRRLDPIGVHAAGAHEAERPVDIACKLLVALPGGRLADELVIPGMDLPSDKKTNPARADAKRRYVVIMGLCESPDFA